jgi:phosphomannomutase/phosphoglucomutase
VEILRKMKMTGKAAHSSLLVAHDGKNHEPKTISQEPSAKSHQLRANSLSSLLSDLPKVYNTPEIRVDCPDTIKFKVVDKVKELLTNGYGLPLKTKEVITVDGVRAVFDRGWGLVRASNTQPVLVMRFEATDPVSLEAIKDLMNENLKKILTDLKAHTP